MGNLQGRGGHSGIGDNLKFRNAVALMNSFTKPITEGANITMKTWNIPTAVAQRFAANDYVSACTASINCDLQLAEGYIDYYVEFGKVLETAYGNMSRAVYTPCGKIHDVNANGELLEITITHGRIMVDGKKTRVPLEEPIDCYYWAEYDEQNRMEDGHCTMTRECFTSNKS